MLETELKLWSPHPSLSKPAGEKVMRFEIDGVKGVAQAYLSLWDSFWELQQWDKSETLPDGKVDWTGDSVFYQILKVIFELPKKSPQIQS